jgi:tetratricopeptide (TPR) repeat protein
MQRYDISDEYVSRYSSEVVELLDGGFEALQEQALDRAERLFRQAIELEPQAREAYHYLGIVYAQQDEPEQAQEVLRAVLEVDPLYVMARCSLALFMLDDDDVQGAQAMIAPVAQVTEFTPREMAFYNYAQAHIFVAQDEFEAARRPLEMALDLVPDYEPARDLLEQIDVRHSVSFFWEKEAERRRRRRVRLQSKLTTLDPSLAEALSCYTKDALTGMGRVVIPWGGWSAYRKAELIAEIVSVLADPDLLWDVLQGLEDQERAALREVMEQGGRMSWHAFEARHDSDLDESPYWNFHQPESVMGRLRALGLLVEAKVDDELWVVIPVEVRAVLTD